MKSSTRIRFLVCFLSVSFFANDALAEPEAKIMKSQLHDMGEILKSGPSETQDILLEPFGMSTLKLVMEESLGTPSAEPPSQRFIGLVAADSKNSVPAAPNKSSTVTDRKSLNAQDAVFTEVKYTTRQILQRADEARGNLQGIKWKVSIIAGENGRENKIVYEVKARSFDTLAESLFPSKDKGNKVLMVNGNMWFYKPGLSKPVPIARRQKLLGTAAYGDIASTNYDDDYTATPLADESVNGELCYVYDLKAKTSKATYDRIKYWISKKYYVGVKAEYFTVSGKKFKSAAMQYDNRVKVKEKFRPFISKIDIQDDLLKGDHTILSFNNAKIGRIPDHVFNLNLLRR